MSIEIAHIVAKFERERRNPHRMRSDPECVEPRFDLIGSNILEPYANIHGFDDSSCRATLALQKKALERVHEVHWLTIFTELSTQARTPSGRNRTSCPRMASRDTIVRPPHP